MQVSSPSSVRTQEKVAHSLASPSSSASSPSSLRPEPSKAGAGAGAGSVSKAADDNKPPTSPVIPKARSEVNALTVLLGIFISFVIIVLFTYLCFR